MEMQSPTVSVIIPVRDAEATLKACLDSLIAQTLTDIEILCVENGSADGTREILTQYAEKDSRIRVLTNDEIGAGAARNRGLDEARGEWIFFADADDRAEPILLERAVNYGKRADAKVVFFGYYTQGRADRPESPTVNSNAIRYLAAQKGACFGAEEFPDLLFSFAPAAPWCKLYRHSFLSETAVRFRNQPFRNDLYFYLVTTALCDRIAYLPETLYHYKKNMAKNLAEKGEFMLSYLDGVLGAREELIRRDAFAPVEQAWTNQFVSDSYGVLNRPNNTVHDKAKVLRALTGERVAETGWRDHPDDYYANEDQVESLLKDAETVLAFYDRMTAKPGEPVEERAGWKEKEPVISALVPVSGKRENIRECLNSLLNQAGNGIEVICVHDGKDAETHEQIMALAKKEKRLSVHRLPDAEDGELKNRLAELARGRYLLFAHPENVYLQGSLKKLMDRIGEDQPDTLIFPAGCFRRNNRRPDGEEHPEEEKRNLLMTRLASCADIGTVAGDRLTERMLDADAYTDEADLRLIRRQLFAEKGIRFRNNLPGEDAVPAYLSVAYAERAAVMNERVFLRRLPEEDGTPGFVDAYGFAMAAMELFSRTDLPEQAAEIINRLTGIARKHYSALTPEETECRDMIPDARERAYFNLTVADYDRSSAYKRDIRRIQARMSAVKTENMSIRGLYRSTQQELNETGRKTSELNTALKNRVAENDKLKERLHQERVKNATIENSREYRLGKSVFRLPNRIRKKN